jgi:hypothetical protein
VTGRIYTSQPNVQQDSQPTRISNANAGAIAGQIACEVDYRQADCSVIGTVLDRLGLLRATDWPADIYTDVAQVLNCSRDEAKAPMMQMLYGPNSCSILQSSSGATRTRFLHRLAEAVDDLKTALWLACGPDRQPAACVPTIGGKQIGYAALNSTKPVHRGTLLCRLVQGSVADALNPALRQLLVREQDQGWRVLFPVHDAVLMLCPPTKIAEVQQIMETAALAIGVPLRTKVTQ